jgi:hypothetical protein
MIRKTVGVKYEVVGEIAKASRGRRLEPSLPNPGKPYTAKQELPAAPLPERKRSALDTHQEQFPQHLLSAAAWYVQIYWSAQVAYAPRIGKYSDAPRGTTNPQVNLAGSTYQMIRAKLQAEEAILACADWLADAVIDHTTGKILTMQEFAARWYKVRDPRLLRGFSIGLMRGTLERLYGLQVMERALSR